MYITLFIYCCRYVPGARRVDRARYHAGHPPLWSLKAALYLLVSFRADYQRLQRHCYTSSTINRMPGPGT